MNYTSLREGIKRSCLITALPMILLITGTVFFMAGCGSGEVPMDHELYYGSWKGILKTGSAELTMVFHITGDGEQITATVDSPDQGAWGIPMPDVEFQGNRIIIGSEQLKGELKAAVESDESGELLLKGEWHQRGGRYPLSLHPATEEDTERSRPQTPGENVPYIVEEITFLSGDGETALEGFLTIPQGPGQFPAAVLISGSGIQNRDEEIMGHKPFHVIADYLTRNGIAVLRYDDRGFGISDYDHLGITTADFAEDAALAVNVLKDHPSIDTRKIGLVGHSEGGMAAQLIAENNPETAFVVLLSSPCVSGFDILISQTEAITTAATGNPGKGKRAAKTNEKLYRLALEWKEEQSTAAGGDKETPGSFLKFRIGWNLYLSGFSGDALKQQQKTLLSPWFTGFLTFDPRDHIRQISAPILALFGGKDIQVLQELNHQGFQNAVSDMPKQNPYTESKVYPDLNHLYQHAETGLMNEYSIIEETFSEEVLADIVLWVQKVLTS